MSVLVAPSPTHLESRAPLSKMLLSAVGSGNSIALNKTKDTVWATEWGNQAGGKMTNRAQCENMFPISVSRKMQRTIKKEAITV